MFCDTVGGANANANANLDSLIETCKVNSVDAYRYLITLFKARRKRKPRRPNCEGI